MEKSLAIDKFFDKLKRRNFKSKDINAVALRLLKVHFCFQWSY
jgi:hypothetical protein